MSGNSILLVEDDRDIGTLLADFLVREAFAVEVAQDGAAVDRAFARAKPDLVILDLMLPGEDGLSICRRLRARSAVPIIMLTAKSEDVDRIVGLELGADDYLGKPFNPRELLARIRAILRRTERSGSAPPARRLRSFAGFVADLDARSVDTKAGARVPLTAAEFDLLAFRGAPAPGPDPRSASGLDARPQRGSVRPHHRCDRQPATQKARACRSGRGRHRHHRAQRRLSVLSRSGGTLRCGGSDWRGASRSS
jgi:two-component system OmpR family response regulator